MLQNIRILYINAMGPHEKIPTAGIFVSQRIKALKKLSMHIIPVNMGIDYSRFAKLILRMKGIKTDSGKLLEKQLNVYYNNAEVIFNLFEIFLIKLNPKFYEKKIVKSLECLLKQNKKIDIIHLHWFFPIGIGLKEISKKYNIPYVITCHGSDINITMKNIKCRSFVIEILEGAAKVEFVSKALFDAAKQLGYSGDNGTVLYNGIDTEIFYVRKPIDKNIIVSKKKRIVGFVGNLISIKGADRLPCIFRLIYEKMGAEVQFLVVGQGELREKLERQMRGIPVQFTGLLTSEELAEQYTNMDILLVPSRAEGFSCVTKEAQACGVVPIGLDVGGIKEAIGKYGITIANSLDEDNICNMFAEAVCDSLLSGIDFDLKEMVENAFQWSWEEKQKESIVLYNQIITKR